MRRASRSPIRIRDQGAGHWWACCGSRHSTAFHTGTIDLIDGVYTVHVDTAPIAVVRSLTTAKHLLRWRLETLLYAPPKED